MGNTPSKKDKPNTGNDIKKKTETTPTTNNTTPTTSPIINKPNITNGVQVSASTNVSNSGGNSGTSNNTAGSTGGNATSATSNSSNNASKPDTSKNSNTKSTESDKSKRLDDFFDKYKDPEENAIGPDGIFKLCEDLAVDPEDVVILVLAWRLNAKKMGYFSKKEFVEGLSKLNIDSIQKLKSYLPTFQKDLEDSNNFKEIYRFSFIYAKENENNKILDLESACGMLSLVLGNKYPHTERLKDFLMTQKSYRVLNMDQWLSILEFSKVINADVSNYDFEGAWPVLLDEYVEYVKNLNKK